MKEKKRSNKCLPKFSVSQKIGRTERFVNLFDIKIREKYPYNWCDRWCEKCDKTHLCLVYRDEKEQAVHYSAYGIDPNDPKVILDDLRQDFAEIQKDMEEQLGKDGVDFDKILEELEKMELASMQPPMDFEIIKKGDAYEKKAALFVEAIYGRMRDNPYLEKKLSEQVEIIHWYRAVIPVKLRHALRGIWEAKVEKRDVPIALKDAYWTGEIILKGITRSKNALESIAVFESGCVKEVYNLILMLREIEDDLLKILNLTLGKHLKRSAQKVALRANILVV